MTAAALDFNSRTMREAQVSDAVSAALDAALQRKRTLRPPRDYLGASAVGDACERRAQFDYAGAPRETGFSGRTLRIFDRGHFGEEMVRGWLLDAGFDVTQKNQRTGAPYAFSQLDGRFRGHVDGVILDGPVITGFGYPALWENKAVGAKSFKAFEKDGIKARPAYADQVAIYQAYIGLTENPALFTVLNMDTCEILALPVPFDPVRAQRASDRAVRIVQATAAGELLPRPFADRTHFECRMCAFVQRCWDRAG